jgi:hypothetical protein
MATILEFRASDVGGTAKRARQRKRSAEIVIFPGVRYERWKTGDGKTDAKPPAPKRDVLKIVD